jgi:hypothetical protein
MAEPRWRVLLAALLIVVAPAAWGQSFESALSPGPVIAGHAKFEHDCANCHVRFDRAAQDRLCMDCHKPVGADVRARQGYHGRIDATPCRRCHTDHKGRDVRIATFDERAFDHSKSDFALAGAHARVACASCHPPGRRYAEAPLACADCHRKDDVHKGALGPKCAQCHGESTWKDARFDHATTRFALTGRHAEPACKSCHRDPTFRNAPITCVGCHRADDKVHRGRLGERCGDCHGTRDWKSSSFQHDRDTRYVLKGRHRQAKCEACHVAPGGREKPASSCIGCHRADDKHQGSLGVGCADCHSERAWTQVRVDHDATSFPLLGKHRDTECKACHRDLKAYRGAPTGCVDCHRKDDTHKERYGTRCDSCHDARSWRQIAFRHDRDTRYPLSGRHVKVACDSCHTGHLYRDKLRSDCQSCHGRDDAHRGTLGPRCETCHDESTWKVARFDHARTRFALRGGHARVECKACHASALYREAPRECRGCHARDDVHEGTLDARCETCHGEASWKVARYDHSKTRFALAGAHARIECKSCHRSARYREAPRECVGCHLRDDRHKGTLGPDCAACHGVRDWRLWHFDHARTAFALDGAHVRVACEACHSKPGSPMPRVGTTCIECHRQDDIHHGSYGPLCERCHTTTRFSEIRLPGGARRTDADRRPPP